MERFTASLLDGLIRFGKYPTSTEAALLKENGYTIFLDLCPLEEITWEPYSRDDIYYNSYPIPDRTPHIGHLRVFRSWMNQFETLLRYGYKVYIHCRGGHGRSGLVAAILYGRLTRSGGEEALRVVHEAHQQRTEIKPKFRNMGAPQTLAQKRFVLEELQ